MSEPSEYAEKNVSELLDDLFGYIPDKTEDELYQTFVQEVCPYGKCDGAGYVPIEEQGTVVSQWCECYQDEILRRKLKNAKIEAKYWEAHFQLPDIKAALLKPKKAPSPRVFKGKVPANPKPETVEEFTSRMYDTIPIKKGIEYFGQEYTQKTLGFLNESPKKHAQNLLLMGEPGAGKTHLACAVGKEYLKQGKTVYFTTMLRLVQDVLNPEVNIRKIMETKDLIIVDEVGYEYHTDTKWALKQIKELFRIRYNSHLPIVATTNFYPNELNELYDASLMSMFNGSYFFILMERANDYRLEEIEESLGFYTFLD